MQDTEKELETAAHQEDIYRLKESILLKADIEDVTKLKEKLESEFMYKKRAREVNEEFMFQIEAIAER